MGKKYQFWTVARNPKSFDNHQEALLEAFKQKEKYPHRDVYVLEAYADIGENAVFRTYKDQDNIWLSWIYY
jgi:hypothetical protein